MAIPSDSEARVIPDQRRERLMRALHRDNVLSVHQLTDLLGVSHMTVRRDIAVLEQEGLAVAVPGGVRLATHAISEPSRDDKSLLRPEQKSAIAAAAAARVRDDMVVYLDAGTTVQAMVPLLLDRSGLTIVTNDFGIVDALARTSIPTIHTGGRVDHANRSTIGSLGALVLSQLNTDIAFISASSWSLARGVTTPEPSKVDVKQAAMRGTAESVLVADSSKYGSFSVYKAAELKAFDAIVTDTDLSDTAADAITARGIELTLAPATL